MTLETRNIQDASMTCSEYYVSDSELIHIIEQLNAQSKLQNHFFEQALDKINLLLNEIAEQRKQTDRLISLIEKTFLNSQSSAKYEKDKTVKMESVKSANQTHDNNHSVRQLSEIGQFLFNKINGADFLKEF